MKPFLIAALLISTPLAPLASAADFQPASVVHVVTVKWKAGTTPEQVLAALDGVRQLPSKYPGLLHVWVKSIKVQGGKDNAFVMEFADPAAFKAYGGSDAQKEWYKVYLPIRGESTTFDIVN